MSSTRLPNWDREETILALELYVRRRDRMPTRSDTEVIQLSDMLRRRGEAKGYVIEGKFRNPSGVEAKLWNLSYVATDGTYGRSHASSMDRVVWQEFNKKPEELGRIAQQIRDSIK